jgi:hypothetical protein
MLATRLLSAGEKSLARTVLLAAEDLKDGEGMGEKLGKQIKYGTRALISDSVIPADGITTTRKRKP